MSVLKKAHWHNKHSCQEKSTTVGHQPRLLETLRWRSKPRSTCSLGSKQQGRGLFVPSPTSHMKRPRGRAYSPLDVVNAPRLGGCCVCLVTFDASAEARKHCSLHPTGHLYALIKMLGNTVVAGGENTVQSAGKQQRDVEKTGKKQGEGKRYATGPQPSSV